MDRTPEPELMTAAEQVAAYAEADFSAPHDQFVALLRERLPGLPESGLAADLGCGACDISIRFARAYPSWAIDAVDGSQAMLDAAVSLIEHARLSSRIARHRLLLPGDAPGKRRYDLVFSNSLLHHLADPSVLWATVKSWTRLGSAIFVMDLLRPASRDDARKLVDEHARGEPDVLRTDFYNSLLAAYRPDEVRSQLADASLTHLAIEVISDRHWIAWGRVSAAEEKAKSKL
jgi:trans-aconitate methyltransferase